MCLTIGHAVCSPELEGSLPWTWRRINKTLQLHRRVLVSMGVFVQSARVQDSAGAAQGRVSRVALAGASRAVAVPVVLVAVCQTFRVEKRYTASLLRTSTRRSWGSAGSAAHSPASQHACTRISQNCLQQARERKPSPGPTKDPTVG